MKNIILILILFLNFFSFTQKLQFTELEMENYVLEELNIYRNSLNDTLVPLKRVSILDSACRYHNEFLKNVNKNFKNKFGITHTEEKIAGDLIYTGSNKLLFGPSDRVSKYDTEKKFQNTAEVLHCRGGLNGLKKNPYQNPKLIAKLIIQSFMDSPAHNKILTKNFRKYVGISIYFCGDFISVIIIVE